MNKTVKKIWESKTSRRDKFGKVGEYIAEVLLKKTGFKKVRNLNNVRKNMEFADIYAERDNQVYVISVKARRKYQKNGTLNDRYKLGKRCYELAPIPEADHNARAAWVTIELDAGNKTYNAYFGLLSSLMGNNAVPMTRDATREYECLASREKPEDIGIPKKVYTALGSVDK